MRVCMFCSEWCSGFTLTRNEVIKSLFAAPASWMLQPWWVLLLMNSNQEETSSLYTTSFGISRRNPLWNHTDRVRSCFKSGKVGTDCVSRTTLRLSQESNSSPMSLCDDFILYNDHFGLHRMILQMLRAQCLWTGGRFTYRSTQCIWELCITATAGK